jgi:hypothetical protein
LNESPTKLSTEALWGTLDLWKRDTAMPEVGFQGTIDRFQTHPLLPSVRDDLMARVEIYYCPV